MSVYRKPDSKKWWIRYTDPATGRQVRRSAGTEDKRSAEELEAKLRHESWRVHHLGDRPSHRWTDAVVRWIDETAEAKRSHQDDISMLRWLDKWLGGLHLEQIDKDRIDAVIRAKKDEGVSNARVNRYLELIRAILRRAHREWEWLDRPPVIRLLPVGERRIRWITRAEADSLLEILDRTAPHVADMARLTLATGLREANVTGLSWSQVDLDRRVAWIHPDQAKARRAIGVPLNKDAVLVLRRWQGRHPEQVFCWSQYPSQPCEPIAKAGGQAWKRALERAGIEGFRWHDLRHTWASWMVQAGTPLHVLQELGGWSTYAMVQRYAHLAPEHLAEHAARIETSLEPVRAARGETKR